MFECVNHLSIGCKSLHVEITERVGNYMFMLEYLLKINLTVDSGCS